MPQREAVTLFTIGFTKKSARAFFSLLQKAGVRRIVDVRLNNKSQLAGFAKARDLEYFLSAIAQIGYEHRPQLAPTKELLDGYRKKEVTWPAYEDRFLALMRERRAENVVTAEEMNGACLLCSEPKPDKCHRRLVAEYLRSQWKDVTIRHL
jgi:uncharacterized protein (DUF488 family)